MNPTVALNGVAAIALAGYVGAVIYNGNLNAMIAALSEEAGYLEFVAALAVLWYLAQWKVLGGATNWLVIGFCVAVAMKIVADPTVVQAIGDFGAGRLTMWEALMTAFGVSPTITNPQKTPGN